MNTWVSNWLQQLERVPGYLIILLILVLNYASFHLNGNEEQYLLYAKQYMNPDWISSSALNEFAGTRVVYQYLMGTVLKFLSFEQTVFIFRSILCLLAALPLGWIYKQLRFKNYQVLLHLTVLFLPFQSLIGGSWMLVSVEPKGFAYVLILYALNFLLKKKWHLMLLFLVLATYFHILVGLYASAFFILTLLLQNAGNDRIKILRLALVYAILVIPFLFYLLPALETVSDYSPRTSWIYTYFRSPHHTAIFKDFGYFYEYHFMGFLFCLFGILFGILIHSKIKHKAIKTMNVLMVMTLLWAVLATIIAVFDREGIILKYYPFRINTLSTFLLGSVLVWFFFASIKKRRKANWAIVSLLLVLVFSIKPMASNLKGLYRITQNTPIHPFMEMCNFIKNKTPKDAVVFSFLEDPSLTRKMERDAFVVYKFIPAVMKDIPEWYEKELFKRELNQDIKLLNQRKPSYKIDYLLSNKPYNEDFLKLVNSNKLFYLYEVKQPD